MIGRLFRSLPLVIPASVVSFGIVAVVLLLLGRFEVWLVWPLGVIAAIAAGWVVLKNVQPNDSKEGRMGDIAVIVLVILWAAVNSFYASQHIFTNRDPATYAMTGVWLSTHRSLPLDRPSTLRGVPGVNTDSGGIATSKTDPDHLYVRGPHMFPALLAAAGQLGGVKVLLHVAPLFGATALLALYGCARLMVRPRWALLATVVFALTLPLLHFSRDTYSEPLAATITFSALGLLALAWSSKKPLVWMLAGAVAGASAMVRIDGFLTILAMVVAVVIFLVFAMKKSRPKLLQQLSWFTASMLTVAALGWLNVALLSGNYYESHKGPFLLQIIAIAAVMVVGLIGILVAWRSSIVSRLERASHQWRGVIAAGLVILFWLLLASRPLWLEVHEISRAGAVFRNYAEFTVNAIAWYDGLFVLIAGIIGMAMVAARLTKKVSPLLLALFIVVFITSLVYLIKPSIAPDQIWASRRLLPVLLPGIILFAVVAFDRLAFTGKKGKLLLVAIAGLALWGAYVTSAPFLRVRTYVPQLMAVQDTCAALPSDAVVIWIGTARTQLIEPTRQFCHLPTAGYGRSFTNTDAPTGKTLQQIAAHVRQQGKVPVIGLYGSSRQLLPSSAELRLVHQSRMYNLEQTLDRPPQTIVETPVEILMGTITNDGTIEKF